MDHSPSCALFFLSLCWQEAEWETPGVPLIPLSPNDFHTCVWPGQLSTCKVNSQGGKPTLTFLYTALYKLKKKRKHVLFVFKYAISETKQYLQTGKMMAIMLGE